MVAFICLHGKYGEDGTLQGMLEMIGLPYIGSGVWSSALAMDKVKSKVFYQAAGISTPPSITLGVNDTVDVEEIVGSLGERCVVKPATEGSAATALLSSRGTMLSRKRSKKPESSIMRYWLNAI